jgi:hypothetical protein
MSEESDIGPMSAISMALKHLLTIILVFPIVFYVIVMCSSSLTSFFFTLNAMKPLFPPFTSHNDTSLM